MGESSVADALKHLIEQDGNSVAAIAAAVGLPPTTIYSLLKKKSNQADLSILARLAAHFGVGLDYFLDWRSYRAPIVLDKDEETVITTLRGLSPAGQRKLHEYAMDLRGNPSYAKKSRS